MATPTPLSVYPRGEGFGEFGLFVFTDDGSDGGMKL